MRKLAGATAMAIAGLLIVVAPAAAGPPPANDSYSNPQTITGSSPGATAGTTVDATNEVGEPNHVGNAAGHSVWYKWIAPTNGLTVVDTCGSSNPGGAYPMVAVYAPAGGDTVDTIGPHLIRQDAFGCAFSNARVRFDAVSGTEYRIAVDDFAGGGGPTGPFTLNLLQNGSPPANDNFASPASLGSSATPPPVNVDATFATSEAGEPTHGNAGAHASTWYSWTSPMTGTARVNACSSDFYTALAAYQPDIGDTAATILDDRRAFASSCAMHLPAVSGQTYKIAVDGVYDGISFGNVVLDLEMGTPPANDLYSNPAVLSGNDVASASVPTTYATDEPEEPFHVPGISGGASVWYSWKAPSSGLLTADTCGSLGGYDSTLAVYEPDNGDTIADIDDDRLAFNDDDIGGCSNRSRLQVAVVGGHTYRIVIDGFNGGDSTGAVLTLHNEPETVAPDTTINKVSVNRKRRSATVKFGGTDPAPASVPLTFTCKIDLKPTKSCPTSGSVITYKSLRPGTHTVTVTATDTAGNVDPTPAVRTFKVKKPKHKKHKHHRH